MLRRLPPLNALEGLRGRSAARELHPGRRRTMRHAGRGQPSGQGAGSGAWHQAVQPRAPAPGHHRSRPRLPHRRARCTGPYRRRHGAPAAAPELRRSDGQHLAGLRRQVAGASTWSLFRIPSRDRSANFGDACTTSTSRERMSILRSGTATATGPGTMRYDCAREQLVRGLQPQAPCGASPSDHGLRMS